MNYTELKTQVQDITENSFSNDALAMFTEQAEQKSTTRFRSPTYVRT
jgi:hypothetical protein